MKPKYLRRLILLALIAFACPAWADYALDENQNQLAVPSYIKPGFQFLYTSSSSSENPNPNKQGTAGQGFTEYTIIAVLKDKVLVSTADYLTPNGLPLDNKGNLDPDTDPKVVLTGGSTTAFTKQTIDTGEALWMPVEKLKAMKKTTGQGVEIDVLRGPMPYQGKMVNSTTIGVFVKNAITIRTYASDTGLKLTNRAYLGPLRRGAINKLQRKHQNISVLVDTYQNKIPTVNAAWPDWTKRVKSMSYKGTYAMAVPGVPTQPIPMGLEIKFTERGKDYIIGKLTNTTQGGPKATSTIAMGPGTALGYWVHPDVLKKLKNGSTLLENKHLRTKLTYRVQNGRAGRLGVFMLTNDAKTFHAVSAYNLKTGALTYLKMHESATGVTRQFYLDKIESAPAQQPQRPEQPENPADPEDNAGPENPGDNGEPEGQIE